MKAAVGVLSLSLGILAAAVAVVSAIGFASSFVWIVVDPAGDWGRTGDFGRQQFLLSFVMTLALGAAAVGLIAAARALLARKET